MLTGLRLNSSLLRAHVAKHGLSQSGSCLKCNTGQQETTEHFLLDCPHYGQQRRLMARETGAVMARDTLALLGPDDAKETGDSLDVAIDQGAGPDPGRLRQDEGDVIEDVSMTTLFRRWFRRGPPPIRPDP